MADCCRKGPGYASPLEAMKGPKEKLLYVVCVQPNKDHVQGDYLATVDVDPESSKFQQVIHRTFTNSKDDELHHSGWNICSSCHTGPLKDGVRDKLLLPCLHSNNIYIIDTGKNPRKPEIFKVVDGKKMLENDVSTPHTTHCLASGQVMISTLGDRNDNNKGDFFLLDGKTFDVIGTWTKGDKKASFGYDFWYQPYWDTMVSTEWGTPRAFKRGFRSEDPGNPMVYGTSLNVYSWSEQKLKQIINLGPDGTAPLEVRFLHNPKADEGFVGCAIYSNVYRFFRKSDNTWDAEKVISIPPKKVEGWVAPVITGIISDILISLDDKYLYINNWLQGDVRQYDITDTRNPKLTGRIQLGGVIVKGSGVKLIDGQDLPEQPEPTVVKGRRLYGGPQMLQLSLDGKRLYVSTSLYSIWDKQFYPEMVKNGGTMVKIDCLEGGGMKLDDTFLVDFGKEPNGPVLAHEMRYPGGDCTSDIWLHNE
uniref:Putative selenium-binding protein 1 n=1 Tax=Xenopsylla cheopis TaxID=163159 RepID=A0A6M2DNM7_XENCH